MVTCVLCFPRRLKRVQVENLPSKMSADTNILIPRGCTPFGQHQESRPLGRSNDIPVLNGFVNTIDWDQNQSDLSDLTQSMHRVTGSPWIADFRCWTQPEVAILGADQKERDLWGWEWGTNGNDFFPVLSFAQCLFPPQAPFGPNFQWREILLNKLLRMLKVTCVKLF